MFAEAEPLYERSQAIQEEALGPEHHAVATVLNNRALLAMAQVRVVNHCWYQANQSIVEDYWQTFRDAIYYGCT